MRARGRFASIMFGHRSDSTNSARSRPPVIEEAAHVIAACRAARTDGSTPVRQAPRREPCRRHRARGDQHARPRARSRSISGSTLASSPTLAPCSQTSGPAGRGASRLPRRSQTRAGMLLAALEPAPEQPVRDSGSATDAISAIGAAASSGSAHGGALCRRRSRRRAA